MAYPPSPSFISRNHFDSKASTKLCRADMGDTGAGTCFPNFSLNVGSVREPTINRGNSCQGSVKKCQAHAAGWRQQSPQRPQRPQRIGVILLRGLRGLGGSMSAYDIFTGSRQLFPLYGASRGRDWRRSERTNQLQRRPGPTPADARAGCRPPPLTPFRYHGRTGSSSSSRSSGPFRFFNSKCHFHTS